MYTPPEQPADEPAAIADYLSPAVRAAWDAFDKGHAAADSFFLDRDGGEGDERRSFDPHHWAHIARYEASQHLDKASKDATWKLRTHHHSGIELLMEPFRVKVCKALDDKSPQNPGRNEARKRFYQQLDIFGGANLILHWRVRDDDLNLGLCKPRGWWKFKSSARLDWNFDVSVDPIAGLKFEPVPVDEGGLLLDAPDVGGQAVEE